MSLKSNKCVLAYKENKILYGDDKVLMFSRFSTFLLEDITHITPDMPIYQTLEYFYDNIKVKHKDICVMLLNKDFDNISISHRANWLFPQPNCRSLTIVLASNQKLSSVFRKLPKHDICESNELSDFYDEELHSEDHMVKFVKSIK